MFGLSKKKDRSKRAKRRHRHEIKASYSALDLLLAGTVSVKKLEEIFGYCE
jgi:hypothetical protein